MRQIEYCFFYLFCFVHSPTNLNSLHHAPFSTYFLHHVHKQTRVVQTFFEKIKIQYRQVILEFLLTLGAYNIHINLSYVLDK